MSLQTWIGVLVNKDFHKKQTKKKWYNLKQMMFGISSASWSSKLNQYFPLAQVACFRKILKYGWSSEKCCKNSSQNWWIYSVFNLYLYCYFRTSQRVINSDFDDDHDSPKGEVNQNVLVNSNDISDISKDTVDDKGVSSCLKSLRKTRLCRFLLKYLTSS